MNLDPHAVLGIAPGASMAEVKRAYRRMAKVFHPDSAGEAAVPMFLAIHEAYEAIVAGRPMQPQTAASWRRATARWSADPTRAKATRSTRTAGQGRAAGPPPGQPRRKPGPRPAAAADGSTPRRRGTRKATLGSTSYDDAVQEPFEPEWEGASWYGRASGTYWTINPKEYADPRKHGPEYQERARRATRADDVSGPDEADRAFAEAAARRRGSDDARRRARFDEAEAARARAAAAAAGRARMADAERELPGEPDGSTPGAAIESWVRALFAARDIRMRLLLAAIGWPPLGVIAATIISQATGCASFSVTCQPPDDLLPLIAGAALYALLVAVPVLARLSAAGTIAILLTAIPVAAFIVRPDVPASGSANAALALGILTFAWLAGMLGVLIVSRGRILRA